MAASATNVKLFSGRQRELDVWTYFKFDEKSNRSICQVIVKEKICGFAVAKKNTTNLKTHLQRHHPEQYAAFAENDKARTKSATDSKSLYKS